MVHAMNSGGEAQSIADFAVFEPTPDTMVEMHKTLVYENLQDKNAKKVSSSYDANFKNHTLAEFIYKFIIYVTEYFPTIYSNNRLVAVSRLRYLVQT